MITECMNHSEVRTYPKISKIKGLTEIEFYLDKINTKLNIKQKKLRQVVLDKKSYANDYISKYLKVNKNNIEENLFDKIHYNINLFNKLSNSNSNRSFLFEDQKEKEEANFKKHFIL